MFIKKQSVITLTLSAIVFLAGCASQPRYHAPSAHSHMVPANKAYAPLLYKEHKHSQLPDNHYFYPHTHSHSDMGQRRSQSTIYRTSPVFRPSLRY